MLDPVAPDLHELTVPDGGATGQTLALSARALDLWSPAAIAWSFGDGSGAAGAAVSHCYDTTGERTVTVTATDLAGNASSATRTLAIGPGAGTLRGRRPGAGRRAGTWR